MFLIAVLIGLSPGELWLEASESSEWANEYNYRVEAQYSEILFSDLLPDPVLQFSFAGSPIETRNGPISHSIGFAQQIPWPGFLIAKRNQAEASYQLIEDANNSLLLKKRTEIATSWAEVYRHQNRINVLEQRAILLTSLLTSLSGASSTLQIEQSALTDLRIKAEIANQMPLSEQRLLDASISDLMAQTVSPLNSELSVPEIDWFIDIALNKDIHSPRLQIAEASLRKAETELSREMTSTLPDFLLGFSYSFIGNPAIQSGAIEPAKDSWKISLAMNLPLGYSGNNYRIQRAEYQVLEAEAHYMQMKLEVDAELLRQETLLTNTYEELKILKTMLPLSESALQTASTSWIAGIGSYSTLTTVLQSNLDLQFTIIEKEAQMVTFLAKWLELAGATTNKGEFL